MLPGETLCAPTSLPKTAQASEWSHFQVLRTSPWEAPLTGVRKGLRFTKDETSMWHRRDLTSGVFGLLVLAHVA